MKKLHLYCLLPFILIFLGAEQSCDQKKPPVAGATSTPKTTEPVRQGIVENRTNNEALLKAELQKAANAAASVEAAKQSDRKSTRLNSSHRT